MAFVRKNLCIPLKWAHGAFRSVPSRLSYPQSTSTLTAHFAATKINETTQYYNKFKPSSNERLPCLTMSPAQ